MAVAFPADILIAIVLFSAAAVTYGFPATLTLERAFPSNHGIKLSQLRAWDKVRHQRMLQSSDDVVDFPLNGTYDPLTVGLYFTKVQLGSPPREFYVQIDTGSDVLWVSCSSCTGCPEPSGLNIKLNVFDPGNSSTSSVVSCSDKICTDGIRSSEASCSDPKCSYTFQYADGSATTGYYVSDMMQLAVGSATSNSSARVVFGCSNQQSGNLNRNSDKDRAVNGIFGFGPQALSVISQLSLQGKVPRVFSHCLRGDSEGGGKLVLGEIVEPKMVYSPLVPSMPHYNLNLQSISVNGEKLPIDSKVFETSSNGGTVIDSGTTLAYLADEAYDPFVRAVTAKIPESTPSAESEDYQCYVISSSISDVFPEVSLNFAGGATMVLKPQDYLIRQTAPSGEEGWCVAFQKIQGPAQGITILGDIVLKDKIIVYDLAGQRIGWADYDCSKPFNVSSKSGTRIDANAGAPSSGTSRDRPHKAVVLAFFTHITVTLICCFLLF